MDLDLRGQRALVTGAASGIGAAVARRFGALGADVIVTDVNGAEGAAVADEIGGEYHQLDVSNPDEWEALIVDGPELDIAFLNAGVTTRLADDPDSDRPLGEVTERAYRRIMGANIDGVVYGTRAVLPQMVERGRGHIVITASMAGLAAVPFDPIYALTKHAVVGFTKSLGATFGGNGVCTSAICPGFTDTNLLTDELRELLHLGGVPVMSPERVADTVIAAIEANEPGSLWVVWGDLPISRYVPNPIFDEMRSPR